MKAGIFFKPKIFLIQGPMDCNLVEECMQKLLKDAEKRRRGTKSFFNEIPMELVEHEELH